MVYIGKGSKKKRDAKKKRSRKPNAAFAAHGRASCCSSSECSEAGVDTYVDLSPFSSNS
jgi:hypothetical protein